MWKYNLADLFSFLPKLSDFKRATSVAFSMIGSNDELVACASKYDADEEEIVIFKRIQLVLIS